MNFTSSASYGNCRAKWPTGALAGIAGGGVEVAWVLLYGRVSGADAAAVAEGVARSVFSGDLASSVSVPLGIGIHMCLAIVLGMAIAALLARFLPRLSGTMFEPIAVVGLLVAVWAANFFLVLPALSPGFVELLPYGASLTSKVLFGVAAAFVLQFRHGSGPANERA